MERREVLAQIAEKLASKPLVGDEHMCGPDLAPILSYFPREDLRIGFEWCAAFVYHCVQKAGWKLPIKYPDPVPCRFAGVKAWLVWAQLPEHNFYHSGDDPDFTPMPGDLIIFKDIVGNGPHDHIGIVVNYLDGILYCAEGNIENRSGIFQRDRYEYVNGFVRIDNRYECPYE